jgi:inhibitor of cysteine peptidase
MQSDGKWRWVDSARGLALLALVTVIFAPQVGFADTRAISGADNGGEVHLKTGATLELRLKSNPSTGYTWQVEPGSTPLLKLVRQSQTKAAELGVGRPIVQVFLFKAVRSGEGFLQLHYVRSWEKPAPDEERFEIHVFIE